MNTFDNNCIQILESVPLPCVVLNESAFWYNKQFEQIYSTYLKVDLDVESIVKLLQNNNDKNFDLTLNRRVFRVERSKSDLGIIYFLKDYTEHLQLETIRTDFIANLAHELRTPLTSLRGALDTVHEYDSELLSEQRTKFVQIARRHTNRICDIFENILLLSDIERGRAKLITEDIYIEKIITAAIEECSQESNNKKVTINQIISTSVNICGNAPLLISALTNLISNAIKHSKQYGKILVFCRTDNSFLEIDIQDFGDGIPIDQQERIFERFYRNDPGRDRHKGGSGLGLSLVKHIVKAHSGSILVSSKPGEGSVFTIQLPINA